MPTLPLGDDLSINFETWGDPEAPAVVLVHAFTTDLRMWVPHVEAFAEDYFVVAPDLRGHGLSSAPEELESYSIEVYARDLRALLDELGIDLCALIGCSFGGMIALQFAVTWPDRLAALVVSDASPAYDSPRYDDAFRERERRIREMSDLADRYGMAGLARRAAARVHDEFLRDGIRRHYESLRLAGFLGAARARRERPDLTPLLREKLTMPLLLCVGDQDPVRIATDVIAEEVPSATYLVFKGGTHPVPITRASAWREAVLRFLRDVEDGTVHGGRRTV